MANNTETMDIDDCDEDMNMNDNTQALHSSNSKPPIIQPPPKSKDTFSQYLHKWKHIERDPYQNIHRKNIKKNITKLIQYHNH